MRTKLAHVCIESTDLKATEQFYNVLGLERRFEFRNLKGDLVGFYLAFDNRTYIEVIKVSAAKGDGRVMHFAIEADDLDEVYTRLKSHGYEATEKKLESDKTWMVKVHDPDGVFIEIQSYSQESMQLNGGVCEVDYEP